MHTRAIRMLTMAALLGLALPAAAQNDDDSAPASNDTVKLLPRRVAPRPRKAPREFDPHMVKLNLLSLGLKTVSLQYEYGFRPNMSVALGVRFLPGSGVPYANTIRDYALNDASKNNPNAVNDFLDNARVSGFAITPEFRYYVGARPHRGFYIAPFLRYAQHTIRWDYTFREVTGSGSSVTIKDHYTDNTFRLSTFGAGLMVGSQFQFQKVLLDWWILGGSYNMARLDVNIKADLSDRTDAQNAQTERDIEAIEVRNYKVDATITQDEASVTGRGGLPLLRFGLCIGYKF